jgi:hypothetical protein
MNISTPATHRLDCMPHLFVGEVAASARRSNGMPKTFFIDKHSEILYSAHSAFICFAWISEQRAIIALYNINYRFL